LPRALRGFAACWTSAKTGKLSGSCPGGLEAHGRELQTGLPSLVRSLCGGS
jgi:hypothetical protein